MESDSATSLGLWAASIEQAWGIPIGFTDGGAFVLETAAGANVGIEPVSERRALVLTAELGEVDDDSPLSLYQALLAVNLSPVWTGTGCIGIEPQSRKILLRLTWAPEEAHWHEESFLQMLAAFGSHADELGLAIASGEIESVLAPAADPCGTALPSMGFNGA